MNCSTCNASNQVGNFCNQCGGGLTESQKSCQNCGNKEILGEYCHKCGSEVAASNECKNCNAADQTGKFCRKCGTELSDVGGGFDEVTKTQTITCSKCGQVSDRYTEHGFARSRCEGCGAGAKYLEWT